jgi:acetyl-CoA carboxylase beta subunit
VKYDSEGAGEENRSLILTSWLHMRIQADKKQQALLNAESRREMSMKEWRRDQSLHTMHQQRMEEQETRRSRALHALRSNGSMVSERGGKGEGGRAYTFERQS